MISPGFSPTTWLVRRLSTRHSAVRLLLRTRSDPFFLQEERRHGLNLRQPGTLLQLSTTVGLCRELLRYDCSVFIVLLFLALQGRFIMS